MAKKYIPIIAGIIAVVAIIVIAIVGSNPSIGNTDVYVDTITVTTEHNGIIKDGNEEIKYFFITGDNTSIVEGKTTFQLNYTVSPANATYKTVSFTSSDTDIATVDENGLVTFNRNESVYVTLTAKDERAVKVRVQLVWPAEVDTGVSVELDENNNITFENVSGTQYFSFENNTLSIYSGMNYAIDTAAVVTLSNDAEAQFENGTLATQGVETFTITFVFGEGDNAQTKTINVEVVEYIQNFQMGTSYSSYLNTIENLDNKEILLNFKNTQALPYEVGADNNFHFDLSIQNANMEVVSYKDAHLVYTVYEVVNGENTLVEDNSTVFTVNEDGTLRFKSQTVGKSYQVSVVPKYNFLNRQTITFNFKVVEGVNVYTHEELKTHFADLNINNIILHSTIVAEVEENQLDPDGRLINFDALTANNGVTGDIYTRLYTEETLVSHADDLSITISGNYFSIDASDIPYLTVLGNGSGYSNYDPLKWTENSGYPCASIQTSIFKIQETSADPYSTGIEKTNIVNANFNNIRIEGNTSTGILYGNLEVDPDTQQPIVPDDTAKIIADQGSTSAGIMGRGGVMINTNNAIVLKTNIALYQTGMCGGMNAEYTILNDTWATGVLGWKSSYATFENFEVRRAGGAALCFTDATLSNKYSPEWMDLTLTLGKNVIIDNYVSGTEGYFIVNGLSSVVPALKAELNPKLQLLGKTILKDKTVEGTVESQFNFAIQLGTEGDKYTTSTDYVIKNISQEEGWRVYIPGAWLVRQGNFLVNENDPTEKYEVGTNSSYTIPNRSSDTQITIKMYLEDNEQGEPEYTVFERKSGYFNNPVVTAFDGVGLAGLSKISNVDDALLLGGVVGGYIQDVKFVNYITGVETPTDPTIVATLLHGEETLINTAKTHYSLDLDLTSTLTLIKNKITALGTNLESGLQAFEGLSASDPEGLKGISQILYMCTYDILENIKTNISAYKALLENPMLDALPSAEAEAIRAQIQKIITGFESVPTEAAKNATLVQAIVAITANNDIVPIKDSTENIGLIEAKINRAGLGDFSGILIYAGLFDIA